MGGTVLPSDAWALAPVWLNFLDNPTLVQFDHRGLAMLTWAACVSVWWSSWGLKFPLRIRQAVAMVPIAATLQAGLGIATLLNVVPLPLAVAHQAGAFLLFTTLLWAVFVLRVVR
jgi:cytochrome c oxidase assembly protein subunit 15